LRPELCEPRRRALAAALGRGDDDALRPLPLFDRRTARAGRVHDQLLLRRHLLEQLPEIGTRDVGAGNVETIFLAVVRAVPDQHDGRAIARFHLRGELLKFTPHRIATRLLAGQHDDLILLARRLLGRFGDRSRLLAKTLFVLGFAAQSGDDEGE
jgi:hypothetical protein